MGRFFHREIRKGDTLGFRGLAHGLSKLDYALSNMDVENGSVVWSLLGAPTIKFGSDGAGSSPQFIKNVKLATGGSFPSGGEQYQVLQKYSADDGDIVWDWVRVNVP